MYVESQEFSAERRHRSQVWGAYRQFLKDHNVTLITVRDGDQKSSNLFGTFKFPETYIIDRNGIVRRKFIGAVDWGQPEIVDFLTKL
jgi:hypothetical protein